MTNYDSIWGNADNNWIRIDFRECYILNVLLVICWVAVVGFAIFALFTLATGSDVSALFMIACGFIWVGCGISYIRIRRVRRKIIKVIP